MTREVPPLTRDQWAVARLFRDALGLSYAEVGRIVGRSASMAKVGVNDYEQYRTPSGGRSIRPRRERGGTSAHPVEGAGPGCEY